MESYISLYVFLLKLGSLEKDFLVSGHYDTFPIIERNITKYIKLYKYKES